MTGSENRTMVRGWRGPLLAMLAIATLLAGAVGSASATEHTGQVRECLERNQVRYSEPEDSALSQYFDLEAACSAAVDGDDSRGFTLTPTPNRASDGPARSATSSGETASPDNTPSADSGFPGNEASTPSSATEGGRDLPRGSTGDAAPGSGQDPSVGETTEQQGPVAPGADELPTSASVSSPFSGIPGWLLALVAAGLLGTVGYAFWEARSHRGG